MAEQEAINQSIAVWRAGASYDLTGSGRTAVKASYSRYGLQVGIDRVTNVNPLTVGSRDCVWTDPNGDGKVQTSEIRHLPGSLQRRHPARSTADGVKWPHSDEATFGVETQLPGAVRVGAMFYYRTNRNQIGQVNTLKPASAYTAHTITVPNGPGGTAASPQPTTATVYNISAAANAVTARPARQRRLPRHHLQGRRVHRHQAFLAEVADAGRLHHRQERRRRRGRHDLNDPNNTRVPDRHHRQRLRDRAARLGQLRAAVAASTSPAR